MRSVCCYGERHALTSAKVGVWGCRSDTKQGVLSPHGHLPAWDLGPPPPAMRMNGAACVPCRIYPGSAGTAVPLYIGNAALL